MPAILFGSISSVVDTSELQRQSFNEAFAHHGLDWVWDRDTYRGLLRDNGGTDRIAEYAAARGATVDAEAIHDTKSARFQQHLADQPVDARPGVHETIQSAREHDVAVGLVTTTSPENVAAVLQAAGLQDGDLDVVTSRADVDADKPSPEVYRTALQALDVAAADAVAIEDNVGGVAAATAAGITCIALPNANTTDHDFSNADQVVDTLNPEQLVAQVTGASTSS